MLVTTFPELPRPVRASPSSSYMLKFHLVSYTLAFITYMSSHVLDLHVEFLMETIHLSMPSSSLV